MVRKRGQVGINLLRMRLHLRQDTRHCGEQRTKAFEEAVVSFTLARVLPQPLGWIQFRN
jgi:hypothetical protein